jgi:hypothetical protein
MEQIGADFVASGEVVGQRPMSQKRRDLDVIAFHSGLEDLLLRPLSAKRLPPTRPERDGWVDRERLYAFTGQSRKGLIQLARRFEFTRIPDRSTGCALTEPGFSHKVFDLIQLDSLAGRWDFELLNVGRHFRFGDLCKVVVGRRESENQRLGQLHASPEAASSALLTPRNYVGAAALVVGPPTPDALEFAAGLLCRYGKTGGVEAPQVDVRQHDRVWQMAIRPQDAASRAQNLATL